MGRMSSSGNFECEVGGVYHISYYTPPEIEAITLKLAKDKTVPTSGRIFPYISHYLTTGDLVYPAHEGEGPMSELLQEMGRLNLVHQLFPNQSGAKANHSGLNRGPYKQGGTKDDTSTKLRVNTKKERWPGFSKAFSRLLHPATEQKPHQVYRPPQQNKGTTLVIVKLSRQGNSSLKVHGPAAVLESLLPDAISMITLPTHHHINCYAVPSVVSSHSLVVNLEDLGFVTTVRSSWVEGITGALVTQWLMYRRGSSKKMSMSSGTAPRKTSSLGKSLNSKRPRRISTAPRKKSLKSISGKRKSLLFNSDVGGKEKMDSNSLSSADGNGSTLNRAIEPASNLEPKCKNNPLDDVTCSSPSTSIVSSSSSTSSSALSGSPKENNRIYYPSNNNHSPKVLTIKETREGIKKTSSFGQLSVREIERNEKQNRKSIYEAKFLTLGHKSISVSSILTAPDPIRTPKPKASHSLWNICSKSSVKKVFRVIF